MNNFTDKDMFEQYNMTKPKFVSVDYYESTCFKSGKTICFRLPCGLSALLNEKELLKELEEMASEFYNRNIKLDNQYPNQY